MPENEKSLKIAILEQLQTLITAGFGFVAALAWNSAIQELVRFFFPEQEGIAAKFIYAVLITLVAVIVTTRLSRFVSRLKK